MATDLEHLVVTLEAQSVALDRAITQSTALLDRQLGIMETRTGVFTATMESSFAKAGLGVTRAFSALGIALTAAGLFSFFDKVTQGAESLKKVAANTGLSVETLQEYQLIAAKSGVSQDDLNLSLEMFTRNLGQAAEGNKKLLTVFQALGINVHGPVDQAFLKLSDDLRGMTNIQERNALAQLTLGRSWQTVLPFLLQGSDAIRAQGEEAERTGQIISTQMNDKLAELGVKWEAVKRELTVFGAQALAGAADEFDRMNSTITSQDFQSALANVGKIMADIASAVVQIAGHPDALGALLGASIGGRVAGVPGAAVGAAAGGLLGMTPAQRFGVLNTIPWLPPGVGYAAQQFFGAGAAPGGRTSAFSGSAIGVGGAALPQPQVNVPGNLLANQSQLAAQEQAIKDFFARVATEVAKADSDRIAAQDKLNVQLLQGQQGYYDAVVKMITDESDAKVAAANAEYQQEVTSLGKLKGLTAAQTQAALAQIQAVHQAKLDAIQAEAQAELDAAGPSGFIKQALAAGQQQIDQYNQQIGALGLLAGAAAKYAYVQGQLNDAKQKDLTIDGLYLVQLNQEGDKIAAAAQAAYNATDAYNTNVQALDSLRSGLSDVAAAGITSFSSLSSAADQFLQAIAQMIVRLYVMKPLLDSLFGPQGTAGGGIFGQLFGDLFGSSQIASTVDVGSNFVTSLPPGFAGGGIMTSRGPARLRRYSGGGIATSPQLAMFGEGSTPEAYVPVPNGRIPVELNMPNIPPPAALVRQQAEIIVHVQAEDGTKAAAEKGKTTGGVNLQVLVDNAVAKSIADPGSKTSLALARRGLSNLLISR